MFVNVEFLGELPIENVITSMNYKIEKTIFFGFQEQIEQQQKRVDKFLRKYCDVKDIEFYSVSRTDLDLVIDKMKKVVLEERNSGNKVFFDVTGGESLILVAFGIVSKELTTPMHMYDVTQNKLIELNQRDCEYCLSGEAQARTIHFDINSYIEMYGGKVDYNKRKDINDMNGETLLLRVDDIWGVMKRHEKYWNAFSDVSKRYFQTEDNANGEDELSVSVSAKQVQAYMANSGQDLKYANKLEEILRDCEKVGLLLNLKCTENKYSFLYSSANAKECIWQVGTILELHTCQQYKKISDCCKSGLHIDWDGEIHAQSSEDVLNEVDVLALKGNVATFISCKSGKLAGSSALKALYELETVAERFGGKYAKKVLAITSELGDVYKQRAKEMGIEILKK